MTPEQLDIAWITQHLPVAIAYEPAFQAKAALIRGGLPAQSMNAGGRSSDTPLPVFDKVDRKLRADLKAHRDTWATIRRLLDEDNRRVQFWLTPAEAVPDPDPQPCAHCDHQMVLHSDDTPRTSPLDGSQVCRACAVHERRNGVRRNKVRVTT